MGNIFRSGSKAAAVGICNALTALNKMQADIQHELDRLGSTDTVVVNEDIKRSIIAERVELRDRHGNVKLRFRLWDHALAFLQRQDCKMFGDSHLPEPLEYGHMGGTCSECGKAYLFDEEIGMYVHPAVEESDGQA